MVEAAGGQEAAFLRENKGSARRGRLPLRPGPSLGARRKQGQTGPGGGTCCSFVREEVPAAILWPRSFGGLPRAPGGKG